ncbi:MAG TPA: DoxX family protein [Pyrinomonadaceae bacterium]|nr:DoxX family protein [Pyrinomonadaceae bacterium]
MFRRLIETWRTWATLPLRLTLGLIFIAHGAQKVFGVWGGPGLQKMLEFPPPSSLMKPAWLWMGAAAFAELLGGALVFVGLLTRVGAFLISVVMLTAMFGVHWAGGFFLSNQPTPGIEFTFALLGMALALLITGGGRASIDETLSGPRARRGYKTK